MKFQFIAILFFLCAIQGYCAEPDTVETTRTFPKYKCSYTLPGPDWEWVEAPGRVFQAKDNSGLTVMLIVNAVPPGTQIDIGFKKLIEQGMLRKGKIRKRGSRDLVFQDLAAYEVESVFTETGRTMATRYVITNSSGYALQIVGNTEPVEKEANFEEIMNGFVITEKTTSLITQAETTRTFPKHKCSYTLFGPDWRWVDEKIPDCEFAVRDNTGLVVVFSVVAVPAAVTELSSAAFTTSFDREFLKSAKATKRGSRNVVFKGLPCYQLESQLIASGQTSVSRNMLANGSVYLLQMIGTTEPVENLPDFEAIMNGFNFTEKPVVPEPEFMEYKLRQKFGLIFLVVSVIYVIRKIRKK